MRALEDSSASTTRALTFSLARSSSSSVAGSLAQALELVADHLQRLARGCRGACRRRGRPARCRRTGRRTSRRRRRARAPRAPPGTGATRRARRRSRRARAGRSGARRRARAPGRRGRRGPARCPCARSAPARRQLRGRRGAGVGRVSPARRPPSVRSASSTIASWSTEPAAAITTSSRHVAARVEGRDRSTGVSRMTGARPMIARPSGCAPKTAPPSTSKTLSCGSSSYIAISSSTTSRSGSTSRNAGRHTMSAITSKARRQVLVEHPRVDGGRLLVGAGVELGAHRVEQLVDLGRARSAPCRGTACARGSARGPPPRSSSPREPVPTKKPRAADRTEGMRSVTTRSPSPAR